MRAANPAGIPRWVMSIDLTPGRVDGSNLTVDCRVRCKPWRLRSWLAWRLLTAPLRKDVDD